MVHLSMLLNAIVPAVSCCGILAVVKRNEHTSKSTCI